jgi:adenine-specific DNA-methyltransferase
MASKQKQLGQYFTTCTTLLQKVFEFVKHDEGHILEPSCGEGHIISYFRKNGCKQPFVAIEIDETLSILQDIHVNTTIYHENFLTFQCSTKFYTIVGNPPYFKLVKNPNKQSILKTTNIYVAFIEKAVELLEDNGELIFIIPSDFFKLTSAQKLKELMMKHGNFTNIYHPHKENLFQKATQDVVIFRYEKTISLNNSVKYNDTTMMVRLSNGNIYFETQNIHDESRVIIGNIFDIKVGMVSGAEKIFAHEQHSNFRILTSSGYKNEILLRSMPEEGTPLFEYIQHHKENLLKRKIRKFNEDNWFEWGCLRNIKFMEEQEGKPCIYAKVLTRKKDVFSIGVVEPFDGSLLCMFPKQNIDADKIKNIIVYLNTDEFLKHFLYSGRYKVGQKTLSDASIPHSLLE